MKFDYVDIGTCDYNVSSEAALEGENSLLVEPIKYYLDRIPDRPKQKKVNLAVSNICGHLPVYFVPDVTVNMCNLPAWIRGCNSVGVRHPTVDLLLQHMGLPLGLVNSTMIETVTFKELCIRNNITEITSLKLDTEGHECYILPDIYDSVSKGGMIIKKIKFENQESLGNKKLLDKLAERFVLSGYSITEVNEMDTTIELV